MPLAWPVRFQFRIAAGLCSAHALKCAAKFSLHSFCVRFSTVFACAWTKNDAINSYSLTAVPAEKLESMLASTGEPIPLIRSRLAESIATLTKENAGLYQT